MIDMKTNLYETLHNTSSEMVIEYRFNNIIKKWYPDAEFDNPCKCDAYFRLTKNTQKSFDDCNGPRILIEYKKDRSLDIPKNRAEVLMQTIFYLYLFKKSTIVVPFPTVVMILDMNHCYIYPCNNLLKFLNENEYSDINWNVSPSTAYKYNTEFLNILIQEDSNLLYQGFKITEDFQDDLVKNSIDNIINDNPLKIHIDINNLEFIFYNKFLISITNQSQYSINDLISFYIDYITDPENCYQNAAASHYLMHHQSKIEINPISFKAFSDSIDHKYTREECELFTSNSDNIIIEKTRRRKGEYYTNSTLVRACVDLTDKLIPGWRLQYSVWDMTCGPKVLTYQSIFSKLCSTTLNSNDLKMSYSYNKHNFANQYDALDSWIGDCPIDETKLDPKLIESLHNNEPIVLYNNPPYLRRGGKNGKNDKNNEDFKINQTEIKLKQYFADNKLSLGQICTEKYIQFLFLFMAIKRYYKLTNLYIAVFCPADFLTEPSFKGFRLEFEKEFKFMDGYLINSKFFNGTGTKEFSIGYTIWKSGVQDSDEFNLHVVERDFLRDENGKYILDQYGNKQIDVHRNKLLYNFDRSIKTTANKYLRSGKREFNKQLKKSNDVILLPKFTSGIHISTSTKDTNTILVPSNYLGTYFNISSNRKSVKGGTIILSAAYTKSDTIVRPDNLLKVCTSNAARWLSSINLNWFDILDEFEAPDINKDIYKEYAADSVIYSLVSSGSLQTALQDIVCVDGNTYNIPNHWFYLPTKLMKSLAVDNNFSDQDFDYDYALNDDRYMYNFIENLKNENVLSPEALELLNYLRELTISTFKDRAEFNKGEYIDTYIDSNNRKITQLRSCYTLQLNNFDCGVDQLKRMWSDMHSDKLDKLNKLIQQLENKMIPMVYELGFLRK